MPVHLVWSVPAMQIDDAAREALDCFFDNGLVSEILFEVKSGKEATVYCCRGGEAPGSLLAAKVYRPIESRRFKNDSIYLAGRLHMARNSRARRAALAHSDFGRDVQYATWIDNEWELLHRLSAAGADVPAPIARGERAILLPFLGDERGAAPMLSDVTLDRETASDVLTRLAWNIELMLDRHVVHSDLSPFNILYHHERAIIIDLPQAIDPRLNPAAFQLLARDVENVGIWAKRHGVTFEAARFATSLWQRFVNGEIG
jgi:RIO kinase 1